MDDLVNPSQAKLSPNSNRFLWLYGEDHIKKMGFVLLYCTNPGERVINGSNFQEKANNYD